MEYVLYVFGSIIIYGVWGNTNKTNLYPLFIKQEKAIRIVCHAKYWLISFSFLHFTNETKLDIRNVLN